MIQDFIPRSEAEQVIWLGNFQTNIVTAGPIVGVSPAQVTDMVASCNNIITAINDVEASKTALKEAIASKNLVCHADLRAIRKTAAQIKTDSAYNSSIGESLGIIGSETEFDPASYKPTIAASTFAGFVRIKFLKNGVDGVNIYHRKKGDVAWVFLARDTKSPYDDHIVLGGESKPEHWEYRAYGVIDDYQIGLPSDIVEIVIGD